MSDITFLITTLPRNGYSKELKICLNQVIELYDNNNIIISDDWSKMPINDNYNDNIQQEINSVNKMIKQLSKKSNLYYNKIVKPQLIGARNKDNNVIASWDLIKTPYVVILDDDTFLLKKDLIEWSIQQFKENNNLAVVSEECGMGDEWNREIYSGKFYLERFSSWFFIINKKLLDQHNIKFAPQTKKQWINYLKENAKECRERNAMDRDDTGYFYVQIRNHNLDFINLRKKIHYYDLNDEKIENIKNKIVFNTNGITRLCNYYLHLGHFARRNLSGKEYNKFLNFVLNKEYNYLNIEDKLE
ncbi:MAG: glycosyltransferase family A protein [archaeon]